MITIKKITTQTIEITKEQLTEYVKELMESVGYTSDGCSDFDSLKHYLNEDFDSVVEFCENLNSSTHIEVSNFEDTDIDKWLMQCAIDSGELEDPKRIAFIAPIVNSYFNILSKENQDLLISNEYTIPQFIAEISYEHNIKTPQQIIDYINDIIKFYRK